MASAVMASPANVAQSPSSMSPPRKNLKRPAPVNASASRPAIPSIRTPGFSQRSPGLPTDKMLPSQLPRSPASPWMISALKSDDIKTPITPPSAYSDFLTALSPAMSTPMTARSAFSNFSFTDRNGHLTPITQPSTAASFSANSANESKRRAPPMPLSSLPAASLTATSAPLVPPSPFVRPNITRRSSSARRTSTLQKLTIPDSPSFSPITESAGNSAITRTPASATRSARTYAETTHELRSPFSPTSWYQEGKTRTIIEPPKSAGGMQTVSVRQVVTRTVTYTRTPLEPAPKRRRRMAKNEGATPIDPRMMPFSTRREPPVKEEDAQSEYTTASDLSGSVTDSGESSDERRSEKEGSADTALVVKVEGPAETEARIEDAATPTVETK